MSINPRGKMPTISTVIVLSLCTSLATVSRTLASIVPTQEAQSVANQFFVHMRLEQAKDLLEQIPNTEYSNCSIPLMLGLADFKLNQYQKAADAFEKAKKFPFQPTEFMGTKEDLYLQCGYCYYKTGQYQKAIDNLKLAGEQGSGLLSCAQYRTSEKKDPPSFLITEYKPRELGKMNPPSTKTSFDETESYYLQQLTPTTAINLEEFKTFNQFPGKGDRKSWEKSMLLVKQAKGLEDSGKFKEAQAKYEKAIELYPYDSNACAAFALCKLTTISLDAKDTEIKLSEVINVFSKAASLNNSDWKIWNDLACIQLMTEPQQLQDARKSLRTALACNPAPPPIAKAAILHTMKLNVNMDELKDQVKGYFQAHPEQ